jgi:chemotaxis-related protein WspB
MLFLHFQIGDDGFALAADRIVELLPLVELKKPRHAPEGVAGSFDYRGRFVAVIDLCQLELGRPARRRLSTRIIMARLADDEDSLIGLIVENATETLRREPSDFAPFATGPRGLVQRVELESLLPARLRACARGDLVDNP